MTNDQEPQKSDCCKVTLDKILTLKKVLNRFWNIGRVFGKTKRRPATKKPKRVFKCPDCGNYHLTSQLKYNIYQKSLFLEIKKSKIMKRKIGISFLVVFSIIALSFLFAKRISQWVGSSKYETSHFIFFSSSGDFDLSKNLSTVVEKDYDRISKKYKADIKSKITVRIFTSRQVYNMAFGNPFPIPRKAGNYDGQSTENTVYILIPKTWQVLPDTIFPPEQTRMLIAHEMAHSFAYQLNPNISGWLTEGIALYEQTPAFNETIRKAGFIWWIESDIKNGLIPKFSELFNGRKITDPLITKDYVFAGSFVDFVIMKYGFEALTAFIKSLDFTKSFGKRESEVQDEWMKFLTDVYKIN
jgi:hypothetical protein